MATAAAKAKAKSVTAKPPFAVTAWPANSVETWPIEKIKPYDKNPRTHPDSQITLLAKLMTQHGVDQPIVVDESGVIIKGHGRLAAAKSAGFTEFPVVVHKGLSDADKRAMRIADNQVALLSGWNEELLRAEVGELRLADYDMPLLGFADLQLVSYLAPPKNDEEQETERKLTTAEQKRWDEAWRRLVKEWDDLVANSPATGVASTEITKGALAVHFMRAQLFGTDIPRPATLAYTGHRLFQCGDGGHENHLKRYNELFKCALGSAAVLDNVRWACMNKPSIFKLLSVTLGVYGHRYPFDFPALLARDLIDEFTPKGGSVLDPCHGWGGRMLGYLLSGAGRYSGFDVDQKTVDGVKLMFDDLCGLAAVKKAAALTCMPYEKATLQPNAFDFALTSPPYFDRERYDGDQQSWRLYKTYEAWVSGFYAKLIHKTIDALKPGGVFALQIGNQAYPLEKSAIDNLPPNAIYIETRPTNMVNNYWGTEESEGELIVIIQKKGGKAKKSDVAARFGRVL